MNTNNDDGWIALNERRPTEADGDLMGSVLYIRANGTSDLYPWNYNIGTHWRRLPAPPRIKTQAEIDAEEDEKAWGKYRDWDKDALDRWCSRGYIHEVHEAFLAGSASRRGKGGK